LLEIGVPDGFVVVATGGDGVGEVFAPEVFLELDLRASGAGLMQDRGRRQLDAADGKGKHGIHGHLSKSLRAGAIFGGRFSGICGGAA
jgi:hypothetical protein